MNVIIIDEQNNNLPLTDKEIEMEVNANSENIKTVNWSDEQALEFARLPSVQASLKKIEEGPTEQEIISEFNKFAAGEPHKLNFVRHQSEVEAPS